MSSSNTTPRPSRAIWSGLGIVALILVAFLVLSDIVGRALVDSDDDGDDPVTGVTEVTVDDNEFEPDAIEVPVGTTVTWRWSGDAEHNVVGDGFESPVQEEGDFSYAFTDSGTFDYRCTLHPLMRGEVVVTDKPSP